MMFRLMVFFFILREIRLLGMFEIFVFKEFIFACLDDRNILYFQGYDDIFVYCENVIYY